MKIEPLERSPWRERTTCKAFLLVDMGRSVVGTLLLGRKSDSGGGAERGESVALERNAEMKVAAPF